MRSIRNAISTEKKREKNNEIPQTSEKVFMTVKQQSGPERGRTTLTEVCAVVVKSSSPVCLV